MISYSHPVESPEGITFSYDLASLADRGKAYILDLLIRLGLIAIIGAIVFMLFQLVPSLGIGLLLILAFFLEWGYFVFFELIWEGQSPGKRFFHLRVIKTAGHFIGFHESLLRNLLRAADLLPLTYAVGALSMMVTHRFQRLGDVVADTMVVVEKRIDLPVLSLELLNSVPSTERSVLNHSPLNLSHQERYLLQEFSRRKDKLHPDRQKELAQILSHLYSKKFNLPIESNDTDFLVTLARSLEKA